MFKPIQIDVSPKHHYTVAPDMPIMVHLENKTPHELNVEVFCNYRGEVAIIIRETKDTLPPMPMKDTML